MTDNAGKGPSGGVTPHLTIHDGQCAAAIAFYEQAFGAEQAMAPMQVSGMPGSDDAPDMRGDPRIMHAHLKINGGSLMLADAFPEFVDPAGQSSSRNASPVTLHLQVDDSDRWFDRAVAAGATPTMPLADMFWGDRYGQLNDPFGHSWAIGGPVKGDA